MTDSEAIQTSMYRLLDRAGDVIDARKLPTDGEALAWADSVHRHTTPRVWVRRVERQDGQDWTFVSPPGEED
jgi:hypothetical protein